MPLSKNSRKENNMKKLLLTVLPILLLGNAPAQNNHHFVRALAEETVVASNTPTFIGFTFNSESGKWEKTIDVNINDPISLATAISQVSATSNNEIINVNLVANSKNYPQSLTVGIYPLEFEATSSDGTKASATLNLNVVDNTAPIIVGPNEVKSGYSNPKTLSQILLQFKATDNVDKSVPLSVSKDNYTANKNKIGSYSITIVATDSSGNTLSRDVIVKVYDDRSPLIIAPEQILKNSSTVVTVTDIESYISAADDIDGPLPVVLREDNYTGKGDKEGNYNVTFSARDSSGNGSLKSVQVSVNDAVKGNAYMVDYNKIVTYANKMLTQEEIQSFIFASNLADSSKDSYITITTDTYSPNYDQLGTYSYEVKIRNASGTEKLVAFDIVVLEGELGTHVEKEVKKNFFQKIGDFFRKLWNWLTGNGWKLPEEE